MIGYLSSFSFVDSSINLRMFCEEGFFDRGGFTWSNFTVFEGQKLNYDIILRYVLP